MIEAKPVYYSRGKNKGKQKGIQVYKDGNEHHYRNTKNEYNIVAIQDNHYVVSFHHNLDLATKSIKEAKSRWLTGEISYVKIDREEKEEIEDEEITFEKFKNFWLASNGYVIESLVYPKKEIIVKDEYNNVIGRDFTSIVSAKNFIIERNKKDL